jgi:DNA-binding GntR family transcriptional regulator
MKVILMQSIAQQSLHDELLGRLRTMIVGGQFEPGEKIPERQLCEQFGVSRTPLREALKVLAAEGLVQLAPNRGAMVAVLTPEELEECLPIAAALESLTGELACEHITEEQLSAMKSLQAEMKTERKAGDVPAYLDLDRQLHRIIFEASRNPLLVEIADSLFFRVGRNRLAPFFTRPALAQDLADHDEMLMALEARQGRRLAQLLQRHMENLFSIYRSAMRAAPARQTG